MALVRLLLFILHIFVVFGIFGTFLNVYVPPKTFGYINLLSLAFPILMILHILFTLFWMLSFKKRALFFLLVSIFFFIPTRRWINYNPNNDKVGNLKIVTFNSHDGTFEEDGEDDNVLEFMRAQNADIVLLQEQYTNLPSDNFYHRDIIGIYTKHKIIRTQDLISEDYNSYSFYADVDVNGRVVRVINVYLQPFELEKDMVKPTSNIEENTEKGKALIRRLVPTFKDHQAQVQMIRRAIDDSPYPVIVAGDFNAVPNSWEYYHLLAGLKDAFLEVGSGFGTTFHEFKFPIRIDFIFTSKEIKPVSYKIDRTVELSDHFPVIATFDF